MWGRIWEGALWYKDGDLFVKKLIGSTHMMKIRTINIVSVNALQDNMKELHGQWKNLTTNQKRPYERAAAVDANRYRREVGLSVRTI